MGLHQSVLRYYARVPENDTWTLALVEGDEAAPSFKTAVYGMGLGDHRYKKLYLYNGYSRVAKASINKKGSVYLEFANKTGVDFWWKIEANKKNTACTEQIFFNCFNTVKDISENNVIIFTLKKI
jgi:hypothetical protein